MRAALLSIAVLLACDSRPEPSTRYIIEDQDRLMQRLQGRTGYYVHEYEHDVDRGSPRESDETIRFRVLYQKVGHLDVTLTGTYGSRIGSVRACRLEIGPDPVRTPLPIDMLFDLVDDPGLSKRMRDAVGNVDIEHLYNVDKEIDGIRIHLSQFTRDGRPNIRFHLDACGRLTPRGPAATSVAADMAADLTPRKLRFPGACTPDDHPWWCEVVGL